MKYFKEFTSVDREIIDNAYLSYLKIKDLEVFLPELVELYKNTKNEDVKVCCRYVFSDLFKSGDVSWGKIDKMNFFLSGGEFGVLGLKKFFLLTELVKEEVVSFFKNDNSFLDFKNYISVVSAALFNNIIDGRDLVFVWENVLLKNKNVDFEKNLILSSISNFETMDYFCNKLNFPKWTVINIGDFETLLPFSVWKNETVAIKKNDRVGAIYKNDLFNDWRKNAYWIETDKTSNVDFKSQVVGLIVSYFREDKALDLFNFKVEIKKVNLDCNFFGEPLKNMLFRRGKMKTLSRFDKDAKLSIDLKTLICQYQVKGRLINIRKRFLKYWLKQRNNYSSMNDLMFSILDDRSTYRNNIYLPIKKEFLSADESFFENKKTFLYEGKKIILKDRPETFFVNNEFREGVDYFFNLFHFACENGVNWESKKDGELLFSTLVSYVWSRFGEKTNIFYPDCWEEIKIKNIFREMSQDNVLLFWENIKNNWAFIYLNNHSLVSEMTNSVNSKFQIDGYLALFDFFVESSVDRGLMFENSFFDEKFEIMHKSIKKYSCISESFSRIDRGFELLKLSIKLPAKKDIFKVNKI